MFGKSIAVRRYFTSANSISPILLTAVSASHGCAPSRYSPPFKRESGGCSKGHFIAKAHYSDFGPTLATEALEERHGLRVGSETLRRWLVADGMWKTRKQRRTFHQPRLRRESYGELIQIDGSDHRWFEERADPCCLPVFVHRDYRSRL